MKRFSLLEGIAVLMISLLLLCAPMVAASGQNGDGPWKQYKEKDGIVGFEHSVKRSKYLETRAETVIHAPIEVLLEVLMDIPAYSEWMYACKEAIPLEQDGELRRVLYFAQGVPLGSPDRDAVIEAVTVNDWTKGISVTTLQSMDQHPYEHSETDSKRQRMVEFSGKWDLRMLERNRTRVVYTAYTHPGGFAPRFITNGVIRKVSFRSLHELIERAAMQTYIEKAKSGSPKKEIEAAMRQGSLKFANSEKTSKESKAQ